MKLKIEIKECASFSEVYSNGTLLCTCIKMSVAKDVANDLKEGLEKLGINVGEILIKSYEPRK